MKLGPLLQDNLKTLIQSFEDRIKLRVYRARLRLYIDLRDKVCAGCQQEIVKKMDAEILKHGQRTGNWPTCGQISGLAPLGEDISVFTKMTITKEEKK